MVKGKSIANAATAAYHKSETRFSSIRKRPWGHFTDEIRDPVKKVRVWLGTFDSVEDAVRIYDAAAVSFHGSKAKTNFPTYILLPPVHHRLLNQNEGFVPQPQRSTISGMSSMMEPFVGPRASNPGLLTVRKPVTRERRGLQK